MIAIYTNRANNFLFAQGHNIKFEYITVDQGLSQNFITSIFQDSEGFLWVGTHDGLNKYDGYRFTTYFYDLSDSNSLSNNSITTIFEDRFGKLWIGTFGELNCFDKGKNTFKICSPLSGQVGLNRNYDLDNVLKLTKVDFQISLRDIYHRVEFKKR